MSYDLFNIGQVRAPRYSQGEADLLSSCDFVILEHLFEYLNMLFILLHDKIKWEVID